MLSVIKRFWRWSSSLPFFLAVVPASLSLSGACLVACGPQLGQTTGNTASESATPSAASRQRARPDSASSGGGGSLSPQAPASSAVEVSALPPEGASEYSRSEDSPAGVAPPTFLAPAPGTRILHIGDSMAGALGIALKDEFKAIGAQAFVRFQTASFIPNWASGKEIGLYVTEHRPDLVLITLGTNEMRIQDPAIRAPKIRQLVARLGNRPCVWIAPPLWGAGDTGLLPVIRANCAPCAYLDTPELYPEMPRLPDKVHPTIAARKEWAKRVMQWLLAHRLPHGDRPWDLHGD